MERSITDTCRRVAAGLLLGLAASLFLPGQGAAKALLDVDFTLQAPAGRQLVREAGGRTGFLVDRQGRKFAQDGVEYGGLGLSPSQGAVQILVAPQGFGERDLLLEVEGAFQLMGRWYEGTRSWVDIWGLGEPDADNDTPNDRAWGGYHFPLGREVAIGQWFVVTVVWDRDPRNNRVYIDDVAVAPERNTHIAPQVVEFNGPPNLLVGHGSLESNGRNRVSEGTLIGGVAAYDQALTPAEVSAKVAEWLGTVPSAHVASVAAEKTTYGNGQEIVVTLRGTADQSATFTVEGVASDQLMDEVDDGVYVGQVSVPSGVSLASAALTGTLTDAQNRSATAAGLALTIDSEPPQAIDRVLATVPWGGEIEVSWEASPSPDVSEYWIYRSDQPNPYTLAAPYETVKALEFVDRGVIAGIEYYYVVVPVDQAGNRGEDSPPAWATAVAGEGPLIASVTVTPFGKPAKPGETVTVTVTGQSGAEALVQLGELPTPVVLTEQGRSGTYVGTYTVDDIDVGATQTLHRLVAHLSDAYGAVSNLAGPELAIVGRAALNDTTPPVIANATHDGWQTAGFSGKLVAGDIVTVALEGEPAGYASFEIVGVTTGAPMAEVTSGTYTGTYTVGWGDEGTEVRVIAKLADDAGNETTVQTGRTVSLDTRVRLRVTARDSLLPADRKSTARLVAKAENANGDEVSGHELALTLSTTEEYTGVVGGGRLADREARMEDEDDIEVKWGGVTDAFGEVAATYTAGFAAKTALLIAKDLTTGDVGAGWLNTYVASTVAIELTPRAQRGATDQAVLTITADPAKLTADGRSKARIRARLTDLSGNSIRGARIVFSLGNDNGRLKALDRTTDNQGLAEAEYRAGTLMGTVTVTAAVREYGVTASVQIVLMADAPAKIDLVAGAARLPADGRSETPLSIRVSDIHDNPNAQVPVTFAVLEGSGDVSDTAILTDRNGEGEVTFEAGTRPGITVIEARHTSRPPTEEELRRVYGTVFVPRLHARQERDRIKVQEWLVEPEDEVAKGQELVTLESRKGSWSLTAPAQGVFVRTVKHRRDRVELGDTLGYVEIDPEVWAEEYGE